MSVRETYRILGVTDFDEYRALTGIERDWYAIIISAKVLDLHEGSNVHTKLWAMFPEGTITGDALRDPANGLVSYPPEE
jgi:hypothetical protein